MQLGYFTPPVGMNLFIASYRFNKPVLTLYQASLPFFAILLVAVLIITYWPTLSLGMIGRHGWGFSSRSRRAQNNLTRTNNEFAIL